MFGMMLKKTYRKKGMAVTDKIVGFLRFGDMIDVKADSSNVLKSILTLSESMRPTEQLADRSIVAGENRLATARKVNHWTQSQQSVYFKVKF